MSYDVEGTGQHFVRVKVNQRSIGPEASHKNVYEFNIRFYEVKINLGP